MNVLWQAMLEIRTGYGRCVLCASRARTNARTQSRTHTCKIISMTKWDVFDWVVVSIVVDLHRPRQMCDHSIFDALFRRPHKLHTLLAQYFRRIYQEAEHSVSSYKYNISDAPERDDHAAIPSCVTIQMCIVKVVSPSSRRWHRQN